MQNDAGFYTEGMRPPFTNSDLVTDRVQIVDFCSETTHEQVYVSGSNEPNSIGRSVVVGGEGSAVFMQPAVHTL